MKSFLTILEVTVICGGILWALAWAVIRFARKTEEDAQGLIVKGLATLFILGVLIFKAAPWVARGGYEGAFGGVPLTAACAMCLAILWGRNVGALCARSLTNMFDGGDVQLDPTPFYSIVRSQLKLGKTDVALAALQEQLARFPEDFQGLMLLAEIQAEHLHDMDAAAITIQRIANTPERPPGAIAGAFSALADWRLRWQQDPVAAREAFEEILARLPDSEWSMQAAQRIAHLSGTMNTPELRSHEPILVPQGVHFSQLPKRSPETLLREAWAEEARLVAQLAAHPLDTEARERLALVYGRELGQPDRGIQQLEFLLGFEHEQPKHRARWLNLLADLQIESGADPEAPRQTLQRIVDAFADTAAAETARRRLSTLAYEFKGKQKSQAVKLGSYEQNIGLKKGWRPPTAI